IGLREWILESHFWHGCASGAGISCQTRARSRRCAESCGRSRRVLPDAIESPYWRYPASAGDFLPNAEVRLMRLSGGAVARYTFAIALRTTPLLGLGFVLLELVVVI